MTEPPLTPPPPSADPPAADQPPPPAAAQTTGRSGASLIALGILSSRLVGFVREFFFARYFGVGPHADVFRAALRAPNAIQNLLGEGTLSAAFIPLYTRMVHEGREEDAGRFAGAVFGLLLAVAGGFSLLGVLLARPIVAILSTGFLNDTGPVDRYELAVAAVRIIFPMTGFLVLSVWALGILNSHRKFLVPYIAPVAWNAAIIAAMLWAGSLFGGNGGAELSLAALDRLLFAACWGALAGGLLQFLVQLPVVAGVLRGFRLSFSPRVPGVPEALRAVGPVVAGRGVVQLAGYLDQFLASFLAVGAVSALGFAQMPYLLPISLFAMSVAAAELPELSRLGASAGEMAPRVRRSLRQMAFLNVPTFVGYLAFGLLIVGLIYRTGRFTAANQWLVYLILCGYTSGLLATTSSRLLQNTFYALRETAVPARIAAWRVGLSAAVGLPLMLLLDRVPVAALVEVPGGEKLRLGAVGLSLASGVGAWFELLGLQAALKQRGATGAVPWKETVRLLLLAGAAAAATGGIWRMLPRLPVAVEALVVVGSFGLIYLGIARWLAAEEMSFWIGRFGRRLRR